MIRWTCPNGCPAVLGPTRPPLDGTCRFCLPCSAGRTRLVRREPSVLVKRRAAKEARERAEREAARAVRELERDVARRAQEEAEAARRVELAELERRCKQATAIDYQVRSDAIVGTTAIVYGVFDELRAALECYRQVSTPATPAVLTRVKNGRVDTGCWHGRKFVGWETPDGRRISRHE